MPKMSLGRRNYLEIVLIDNYFFIITIHNILKNRHHSYIHVSITILIIIIREALKKWYFLGIFPKPVDPPSVHLGIKMSIFWQKKSGF